MLITLAMLLACSGGSTADTPATTPRPTDPPPGQPAGQQGPPSTPTSPPPPGQGMQDLSGFPVFHSLAAPEGPEPGGLGAFSAPVKLTGKPAGGYRPQLAVGADGGMNVVYYDRDERADVVIYRSSEDGERWSDPLELSPAEGRNWGPDLIARADGSLVVTWDHAEADRSSQGWMRSRSPLGVWGEPWSMTRSGGGYEVGSTHVAPGVGEALYYVYIGRPLGGPGDPFFAYWRYFDGASWTAPAALTDGRQSAWHANVEARPDGSVEAGWDEGPGGGGTELFVVDGRDGRFGTPENLSAGARQGERPHWAFGPDGVDHVVYFHRGEQSRPLHVFVRAHTAAGWGPVEEPSAGLGGYHFDPEIAVSPDGLLCMVWGWDAGDQAELLYSLNAGEGWSAPLRVAEIGWGKPGLPSIDVDHEGRFHVVWNQGIRGYNEVYYASLAP